VQNSRTLSWCGCTFGNLCTCGTKSKQQPAFTLQACGSGATTGGLALANHLSGYGAKVIGYGVCDDEEYFYNFIDGLYDGLGIEGAANIRSRDIMQVVQAKGAGYAISRCATSNRLTLHTKQCSSPQGLNTVQSNLLRADDEASTMAVVSRSWSRPRLQQSLNRCKLRHNCPVLATLKLASVKCMSLSMHTTRKLRLLQMGAGAGRRSCRQ
jgi:hypothetical protein